MAISNLIASEFAGARDLSGIGGVETGNDAAEFLLLGANSVQVSIDGHFKPAATALSKAACHEWGLEELAARDWSVRPSIADLISSCLGLQVCTGVMLHGYPLVKQLCGDLQVIGA